MFSVKIYRKTTIIKALVRHGIHLHLDLRLLGPPRQEKKKCVLPQSPNLWVLVLFKLTETLVSSLRSRDFNEKKTLSVFPWLLLIQVVCYFSPRFHTWLLREFQLLNSHCAVQTCTISVPITEEFKGRITGEWFLFVTIDSKSALRSQCSVGASCQLRMIKSSCDNVQQIATSRENSQFQEM